MRCLCDILLRIDSFPIVNKYVLVHLYLLLLLFTDINIANIIEINIKMQKPLKTIDFSNIYSPKNRTLRENIFKSRGFDLNKTMKVSPSPPPTNSGRAKQTTLSSLSTQNILKIREIA